MSNQCNYISIDHNKAIIYVIKLLKQFDDNLEKGELSDESYPYHDNIYMKTDNGYVEIPHEIINEAKKKWEIIKANISYNNQKKNIEDKIKELSNKLNEQLNEKSNIIHSNNIYESFYNKYFNYIFIIIIIIIIIIGIVIYKKIDINKH